MTSPAFTSTLREPYHRTILKEIYELYDGMESILNSDVAMNAYHARVHGEKSSTTLPAPAGGVHTNVPFGGPKQTQFTPHLSTATGATSSEVYCYFLLI